MRWLLAVFLAAGCAGASDVDDTTPEDTDLEADTDTDTDADTDTDPAEEPIVDLRGEWTFGGRDLLPEQGSDYEAWLHAQDPEDYPEIEPCVPCADRFVYIVQGMRFEDDGTLVHTFVFSVGKCDPIDEIVECRVERDYGTWSFDGNEGDRAVYTVNGDRTWEAFPISDYVRVYEGARNYTLYVPE
jgi:hypothetical protein